jgi:hypothetical protein
MTRHQRNRASLPIQLVGLPNIHASLLLALLAITVLISAKSGYSMG